MSEVKLTHPRVRIIARQSVDWDAVNDYLGGEGITWETDAPSAAEATVEIAGRCCYRSFSKPRPGGNEAYLDRIKENQHGSVAEHAVWTLLLTGISRSLAVELLRHRAGISPSQESQRFVDASMARYVVPPDLEEEVECALFDAMEPGEEAKKKYPRAARRYHYDHPDNYYDMVSAGEEWLRGVQVAHTTCEKLTEYLTKKAEESRDDLAGTDRRKYSRQAARSVLPNAAETRLVITANARALRNFFEQRANRHADSEIRRVAGMIWEVMKSEAPNLFGDYSSTSLPDGTFELSTPHKKI